MSELSKQTGKEVALSETDKLEKLQGFNKLLHKKPTPSEVKVNNMAGGSKYVPISTVEMKLDKLFFGAWKTEKFKWQQIGNEITGSIELWVYHPIMNEWIKRTGAASVVIQFSKGADITDFSQKIKNTLVKDFPHLKAECLKNAAKSLGKTFGRDLNRKDEEEYTPFPIKKETVN